MILRIYILVLFTLTIIDSTETLDEADEMKADEMMDSLVRQLKAMELRMSNQEQLIKDLKVNIDYLQIAEPKLGVIGLMKDDDALGEIVSKSHPHQFTHVAAVSLRVPQRDLENLPKNRIPDFKTTARRNSVQAIITVNSDQQIQLWDAELNELMAIPSSFSCQVTAIKAWSANERAYLLVGGADGSARVFSVSAWRISDKEKHTQYVAGFISELSSRSLSVWNSEENVDATDDWPSAIQDIGYSNRRNTEELLVGYSNGWLRLYEKDGKMKDELYSGNSSVLAIGYETDRMLKPVFTTSGFRFCKLNTFKMIGGFCRNKENTKVTGHVFDLVKNFYLYVGYSDGRIVLFDTKSLGWKRLCKPKLEIEVESGAPLRLEVTEGYLLASSPTTLYVFNITGVSVTNPPALVQQRGLGEDGTGVFGALTSTLDVYHHTLIVATQLHSPETCQENSNGGSTMVVYESYRNQKEKRKRYTNDWFVLLTRAPLFIIGGLVIAWKFTPLSKLFAGGPKPQRRREGQMNDYMSNLHRDMFKAEK